MSGRPGPRPTYLPAWPLFRAARERGTAPLHQGHRLRRTLQRARQHGSLTVDAADKLAIVWLGVHPVDVWPDWFELDETRAR